MPAPYPSCIGILAYFGGGSLKTDLPLFAAMAPVLLSAAAILAGCFFYSAMKDRGDNGEPLKTAFMDNGYSMACLNTLGILCMFVLPVLVYGQHTLSFSMSHSLAIILMILPALIGASFFLLAEDCRKFSTKRMRNWRKRNT